MIHIAGYIFAMDMNFDARVAEEDAYEWVFEIAVGRKHWRLVTRHAPLAKRFQHAFLSREAIRFPEV